MYKQYKYYFKFVIVFDLWPVCSYMCMYLTTVGALIMRPFWFCVKMQYFKPVISIDGSLSRISFPIVASHL